MTFTELALELEDERVPMCHVTAQQPDAHGIFRILDDGRSTGRFVALVTLVGPRDTALDLAREMARDRPATQVEVVAQDTRSTTLRSVTTLDRDDASQNRLFSVLRLFEKLGPDVLVDAILFRGGRMRARLIVPRALDNATIHVAVSETQARGGFKELRLIRAARLDPERHVEVMRPLLNPDQDELLRLAMGMGYYENPKRATLEDISQRVGLSISPIHKRLKAAEELLVAAHVGGSARVETPTRRRLRRRVQPAYHAGPCDVDVAAQAPEHALSRFARANRGARVLLQPLPLHNRVGATSWLALATGNRQHVAELRNVLQREQGITHDDVSASDNHACFRIHAASDGGWSTPPIAAAFAGDAVLRRLVFDGDDVFLRLAITAGGPVDDLESRISKTLAQIGWTTTELLATTPTTATRVPVDLPEPLSPRQEEVLKVAHALGYYRTPRGCTLEQVANTLGVSANAIHKNLVGAEARIITHYLHAGA